MLRFTMSNCNPLCKWFLWWRGTITVDEDARQGGRTLQEAACSSCRARHVTGDRIRAAGVLLGDHAPQWLRHAATSSRSAALALQLLIYLRAVHGAHNLRGPVYTSVSTAHPAAVDGRSDRSA